MSLIEKQKVFGQHPTVMLMRKALFESMFVVQFVYIAFNDPDDYFTTQLNADGDDIDCRTENRYAFVTWASEFLLCGSEMFYFALIRDLHRHCTNPFTDSKKDIKLYTVCGIIVAVGFATALTLLGPTYWGISLDFGFWVQSYTNFSGVRRRTLLILKFCMLYIYLYPIYMYGIYVYLLCRRRLHVGLNATLNTRRRLITKTGNIVIGYTVFWTIFVILDLFNFFVYNLGHVALSQITGFMISARGLATLAICLTASWSELRESDSFINYLMKILNIFNTHNVCRYIIG